ncbi:MAG: HAMP domain-containing histidine kinase [Planctomycetes bacterium]|nr:HAMP domain-containing histidine kinase [Planctomycetota bacterium]MCB9869074.1 HAMP domain-containing histidine kinase [Planctomycetota bacterium]MCB9888032.1 HAMP domain-containing histidine kinase [Planctomycetota bacterium]
MVSRSQAVSTGVVFAAVVAFCLLLVVWWVFFLLRESHRLDRATELIAAGDTRAALREIGADDRGNFSDKAQRLRLMFTAEGIAMGLLILAGVFLLYRSLRNETRIRIEQERFLTGTTHHLKTPLATVRLGLESMLAGSMPEAKRDKYLHAMLREVDHLEKDITNLLTAGGLVASRHGLQRAVGDLSEDVRDAADSLRDRFDAAQIELCTRIEDDLPVDRDREAVHLVLHNVLDNAVKHSNAGSSVELSLTRLGQHARLSVRDFGRGIDAADLPRVFDRYFRGRSREHKGGSGIGLFLVRELVLAHGGRVAMHSDGLDRGARLDIDLPLAKENA